MTASGRMFQSRTVRGKKNKGDSPTMTLGCGKPEFSTGVGTGCNLISILRALELQPSCSESCKTRGALRRAAY